MAVLTDTAYFLFLILISPLLAVYLYRKSLFSFSCFRAWTGNDKYQNLEGGTLFHAVSYGEFNNLRLFFSEKKACALITPDRELLLHLRKNWCRKDRNAYLAPLDFSFAAEKMLDRLSPGKIVVSEVDLWPNFLYTAEKKNIPVFYINARISNANSLLLKLPFYKRLLSRIVIYPKSQSDSEILRKAGINTEEIVNLKFPDRVMDVKKDRKLFLAVSTHQQDEEVLYPCIRDIQKKGLCVVVAPRNIQRVSEIRKRALELGYSCEDAEKDSDSDIRLICRMGVLPDFYPEASFAFVGGSFLDLGGHNILEPLAYRCHVLHGPFIRNFSKESEMLIEMKLCSMVQNSDQIIRKVFEGESNSDWDAFFELISQNNERISKLLSRVFK